MKLNRPTLLLVAALTAFSGLASDEIQGAVVDVLSAIKDRNLGRIYAVEAVIATPPVRDDARFIIRDTTGSVIIRRDFDWPTGSFLVGDVVRLRCEIGSTASTPASAYYRGMALVSRNTRTDVAHGNWLVTTCDDESAQVVRLPHYVTAANVTLAGGALIVLSLLIIAWNTLLHKLVDRRSRELTEQRLAAIASDLKVEERTRLAVELHDTIAQTLTGISLELAAARDFEKSDPAEMDRHLEIASCTLQSCRNELRNCMWDLRNQTLDDVSMDEAIRRTLAPHLAGASLAVRFDVPRDIISDKTTLAILRMIRELVLNAVRHGKATSVKIAGCIENERLLFSVRDNGSGFDPSAVAGVEKGHFGLQGITERLDLLNGELNIDSAVGQNTRVSVSIAIPQGHIPVT